MWTKSAKDAELIKETVSSSKARQLLYQARVNLELFGNTNEQLQEAHKQLLFHDFARINTCHMNEGIFGADIQIANMMSEKERVMGFLLAAVTAGYRFTRSVIAARSEDRGRDWKNLRIGVSHLEKKFHDVRNFLEHLDEAITKGTVSNEIDCYFSRDSVLTCKDSGSNLTFGFSEKAMSQSQETYDKIIEMLEQRKLSTTGA
jgi:hypothetical protein